MGRKVLNSVSLEGFGFVFVFYHNYGLVWFCFVCTYVCVLNNKGEGLLGSGFRAAQQEVQSTRFLPATAPLKASMVPVAGAGGGALQMTSSGSGREEHDFCGGPFPRKSDSEATGGTPAPEGGQSIPVQAGKGTVHAGLRSLWQLWFLAPFQLPFQCEGHGSAVVW